MDQRTLNCCVCVASVRVHTLLACTCRPAYTDACRRCLSPHLESPPACDVPNHYHKSHRIFRLCILHLCIHTLFVDCNPQSVGEYYLPVLHSPISTKNSNSAHVTVRVLGRLKSLQACTLHTPAHTDSQPRCPSPSF